MSSKDSVRKSAAKRRRRHLEALHDQAIPLLPETLAEKAPGDLFVALIAKQEDGTLCLLSLRQEQEGAINRYALLER